MAKFSCVGILLMSLISSAAQGQAALKGSLDQTLMMHERQLCAAIANKDGAESSRLLAEDAVVAEYGQLLGRKEGLAFHTEDVRIKSFELSDMSVISISDDVAIVHAKGVTDATRRGKRLESTNYISTIWAQRDGNWKAVYSTSYTNPDEKSVARLLEEELIGLERSLCAAIATKNHTVGNRLLAEDAIVAEYGMLLGKNKGLAFHTDDVEIKRFDLSDFSVIRISDDVAIVHAKGVTDATRNGLRLDATNYISTTWAHRNGSWKAVYSTSYSMPDEEVATANRFSKGALAKELTGLELALCAAIAQKDKAGVDRLLDEKAIVAEHGALLTRDKAMSFHTDGVDIKNFELSEVAVISISDDVAVIHAKGVTDASRDGKRLDATNYISTVWVRRGGPWKAAYSTSYSVP